MGTSWAGEAWGMQRAVELLGEVARIDRTIKVGDAELVELELVTRELRGAGAIHDLHRKIVRLQFLCASYRDELETYDRRKARRLALDAQSHLPLGV